MPDPTQGNDTLTLTIRLHDPKEKKLLSKSTAWAVVNVTREDLKLPREQFFAKYVTPAIEQILTSILAPA